MAASLSEDEAWEIALEDHPDLRKAWEEGALPEEMTDQDGNVWNPELHLSVHAMLERQFANDDPPGIAALVEKLVERGVQHHDIRHLIAEPFVDQLWQQMNGGREFDNAVYLRDVEAIIDELGTS